MPAVEALTGGLVIAYDLRHLPQIEYFQTPLKMRPPNPAVLMDYSGKIVVDVRRIES